jgi:hypothetical protein
LPLGTAPLPKLYEVIILPQIEFWYEINDELFLFII